jgi:proton-translocating NADH-quinone oxidoreductase chain N
MNNEALLLCAVGVPTIGAFVLPMAGRISERLRNVLAAALVLTALVCSSALIPSALWGSAASVSRQMLVHPVQFDFSLRADALAVFMACISSAISAIIVFYSWGYVSHYSNRNEYYLMVVLFLGAMMGLVYATNLVVLYVFWEITAVCSWRLIGFFREPEQVRRADKAFLVTFLGAVLMLLGFVSIYQQSGTFDMTRMAAQGTALPNLAVVLILAGILSKSATLPFHTWLPDAGVAPSPVTALLHAAVLVKIGVYVFARLFLVTFTVQQFWHTGVPIIAALSALVAAGAALIETDLKRIIAYSTVSQIGFIFLGLSTGSKLGIAGGLLYILMHGIAKGGLFLCAGIVEQKTHTKDIRQMGGLIRTMPWTAGAFLFCAFSVMGIPPFGGFFSKYMVVIGAVQSGHMAIALTFLAGAFLTIIYLLRVFNMVFLGQGQADGAKEGSPIMVASVTLLGILALLSGIIISPSSAFVQRIVEQMPRIGP